jgi:hypothetical protein
VREARYLAKQERSRGRTALGEPAFGFLCGLNRSERESRSSGRGGPGGSMGLGVPPGSKDGALSEGGGRRRRGGAPRLGGWGELPFAAFERGGGRPGGWPGQQLGAEGVAKGSESRRHGRCDGARKWAHRNLRMTSPSHLGPGSPRTISLTGRTPRATVLIQRRQATGKRTAAPIVVGILEPPSRHPTRKRSHPPRSTPAPTRHLHSHARPYAMRRRKPENHTLRCAMSRRRHLHSHARPYAMRRRKPENHTLRCAMSRRSHLHSQPPPSAISWRRKPENHTLRCAMSRPGQPQSHPPTSTMSQRRQLSRRYLRESRKDSVRSREEHRRRFL